GHENEICGYTVKRRDFDQMLFNAAKEKVETLEEHQVIDLLREGEQITGVVVKDKDEKISEISCKIVVGADGYNSIVAKKLNIFDNDPAHWMISVRGYYKGVTGMSDAIEMHYCREVIPGYLWIFPCSGGMANVGVCLPKKYVLMKNINLNKLMDDLTTKSSFKNRFKNAELIGKVKGWTLPVGTKKRQIHGNGFILTGDAAGLIDPFSGEGIGNALTSAKFASETFKKVFPENDFSAEALKEYPDKLWAKMSSEFGLSNKLIKLTRYPLLINFVLNRAIKSEFVANWLSGVVAETIPRNELTSVGTYFKLLFK
ncbi:MAG: NAD(P)/FAD-dependent oxidoreductase, partial [Calditrichia bacterium]|nr:NAD(P)/FAD-dependent oxidoreductase [Calditrichia bacterium]